jgi:hypothetical protein
VGHLSQLKSSLVVLRGFKSNSLLQDFIRYMRIRDSKQRVLFPGFNPVAAAARRRPVPLGQWVSLDGVPASPPDFASLPTPKEVLSGSVAPDFRGLRLRDNNHFISGLLPSFYDTWRSVVGDLPEFRVVRPWLRGGVHIPSFFRHFRGVHNGRSFDSVIPPPMYYQNDNKCNDWVGFISETILKRVEEGSMVLLGKLGQVPPPRVINALSVEPTKPRLILSMRAVNLFCQDTPFTLAPLSEIVQSVEPHSFFSGTDDVQGYKQVPLTTASYQYAGFEWQGWLFSDTTLPFGWKNSAYCYTTIGNVLTAHLRRLGIYSELWIDDRFVGRARTL